MSDKLLVKLPKLEPEFVTQSLSEVYDWGLLDLNIPNIHKKTLGEGVSIGIVDSGRSDHFEVQHAIKNSKNFTDSPLVNDKQGHSTFVSGITSAANNSEGVIGVAPKADIYFAKALGDGGNGNPSAMVKAVQWLIQQKVDIISISAGLMFDFKPLHNAVKEAYRKNILVICAAGNSGNRYFDIAFPARYPETISVAAYDQRRHVAPFSSRGISLFCALPGVDVYSCWLDNGYAKMSGTSFACPVLSGICALIISKQRQINKNAQFTPKQMMDYLQKYMIKLGEKNETGFGTINTEALFNEVITNV